MIPALALSAAVQVEYVYDIADVAAHEIIYFDDRTRYFIVIDGDRFIIGTPVRGSSNFDRDEPQGSGYIEDCSSVRYGCIRLAEFAFLAPKESGTHRADIDGMQLTARKNRGKVQGEGACGVYTPKGCKPTPSDGHPRRTYSYTLNNQGVVDRITISCWEAKNQKYETREMALRSGKGLTPLGRR